MSDEDECQRSVVLYILVFEFDIVGYLAELLTYTLIDKNINVRNALRVFNRVPTR